MAYTFQSAEIIGFDVHTAIKPLAFPQFVKLPFRFLVDQVQYGQQYESWQPIETDLFTIRPLKKRSFYNNYFWKHYASMSFGFNRDYWGLQIPFVLEPKNLDLQTNLAGLNFQVAIEPLVYLNAMGWSANVKMRLSGAAISSTHLQEFVGRLRGFNSDTPPFLIEGKGEKLTSVFKLLGERVKKTIYSSPDSVGDNIAIPSQLVISLGHSDAPAKYFKDWQIDPVMQGNERAELLGILYGSKIQAHEVANYLKKTLVTRFRETNFSLTNYDQGSLVFMQENFKEPDTATESLNCLTSNIRSSTMMGLSLDAFGAAVSKIPKPPAVLTALQEQAKTTLTALPGAYNNGLYRNIHYHHPRLRKFLPPEEFADETANAEETDAQPK
jgi:hypothetical protein